MAAKDVAMNIEAEHGTEMSRRAFFSVVGGAALATTVAASPAAAVDEDTLSDWMADAPNYDGTVIDMTREETVTIAVGSNDGFTYDPPAVRISPETTVVWEWTGEGGSHDVANEDGVFQSDLQDADGATFEHQFGESRFFPYKCTPHVSMGMKGAVIVEGDEETTSEESSEMEANPESSASMTGVAGMAAMGLLVLLSPFGLWFRQTYLAGKEPSADDW